MFCQVRKAIRCTPDLARRGLHRRQGGAGANNNIDFIDKNIYFAATSSDCSGPGTGLQMQGSIAKVSLSLPENEYSLARPFDAF